MGDLAGEEVAPFFGAGEEFDGSPNVAGFEGPTAHYGELFLGDDVGVELDVAGVGVLA